MSESNELYHYGVLGMKWGVRRFQPYPSNYTGKGKEIGEAKKRRIGWDDDVIVKKGTPAYRISAKKNDDVDVRYVTVDENDRNFYKGTWPGALKNTIGSVDKKTEIYEQTYRIKEDLVSPSAAKRQKIAADIAMTPEGSKEVAYALLVRNLTEGGKHSTSSVKEAIRIANENSTNKRKDNDSNKAFVDLVEYRKKLEKQVYDMLKTSDEKTRAAWVLGALGISDRLKAIYGEQIIKQNYNMTIDDHGAAFLGKKQRVNSPIIVFKADQFLENMKTKKVSDYSSGRAMAKYQRSIKSIPGYMAEKNFVPNVLKNYDGLENYYGD